MTLLVGTSGWQYRDWRGPFYPAELAQARWLEYYAERFATVEVNNAFYRLPAADVFEAWAARTPADFVVTVKASRFLTHIKRLRDPDEPVARLTERAARLGAKLGPILVQLPPNLQLELDRLDEVLRRFAAHGVRIAVEPRHESWFVPELRRVLERWDAALCWADRKSRPVAPCWRTAGWGYLRLHQGATVEAPCYGRGALEGWAERLAGAYGGGEDVFVYFNNDPRGCAVRDAARFAGLAGRAGFDVTRVPAVRDVVPLPAARAS